jgi:hypothetical protein
MNDHFLSQRAIGLLEAWLSASVTQTIERPIFAENHGSGGGTTFLPDSATNTAVQANPWPEVAKKA